jgi:mono/diheme cytochrome c family protein
LNNPQNQPLAEGRVTLSKSDLITFVAGAPGPKPLATAQPAASSQPTVAPTTAPTAAATTAATTAATKSGDKPKLDMDVLFPPGEGRQLTLDHCMSCHSMAPILVAQKTAGEWKQLGFVHRDKVPALGDAEYDQLIEYLIKNFGPDHVVPELPEELLGGWTNY